MTFPIRLKILREEKGYSQAMLAKEMGIAQSQSLARTRIVYIYYYITLVTY